MQPSHDYHEELKAILAARRELGTDHDEILVSAFLEKVDRELAVRAKTRQPSNPARLAVFGLIMAVPLSAIAGVSAGLDGVAAAWLGIIVTVFLGTRSRS